VSKPRARRVVSRVDARPTRFAPVPSDPERAPVAQREEPEMAEWGEKQADSGASDEGEWMYGGIVVPVVEEPPKPVLKAFRQNRRTLELEWKDAPEQTDPNLPPPTAKQVFGLEPMPGEAPTPAA
jgi:hypothetical protein